MKKEDYRAIPPQWRKSIAKAIFDDIEKMRITLDKGEFSPWIRISDIKELKRKWLE